MITVAIRALLALLAIVVCLIWAARAETSGPEIPDNWWNVPAVRACCSDADAVYADEWQIMPDGSIRATVTGGGPRNHAWSPIGRTYSIPAEKVLREPGNPTGRPLLFLNPHALDFIYCFALGAGI